SCSSDSKGSEKAQSLQHSPSVRWSKTLNAGAPDTPRTPNNILSSGTFALVNLLPSWSNGYTPENLRTTSGFLSARWHHSSRGGGGRDVLGAATFDDLFSGYLTGTTSR